MTLYTEDNSIVVPGEVIASGMEYLPSNGMFRQGDDIRANRLGLVKIDGKVIKSIPLAGVYLPKKHDVVIGKVIDILMSGWRLDLHSPYTGVLGLKDATFDFISKGADLTKYFDLDDVVVVKIIQVTSQNLVDVTCKGPGLKKLVGGRMFTVNPMRVPRIIGTQGSMISMVKKATSCKIVVGQNGVVWINGEPSQESLAFKMIKRIESLSHTQGLTDRMKQELERETGLQLDQIKDVIEEEEPVPQRPPRRDEDTRRPFRPRFQNTRR